MVPHLYEDDGDGGCALCPLPRRNAIHGPPAADDPDPLAGPALPAVDRDVVAVGARHPVTSRVAADRARPRSGTKRAAIFAVLCRPQGATDDEVEEITGWRHEVVSGARNTLMHDGLVFDTGQRRPTRRGNPAGVYRATPAALGAGGDAA
jgi:hypothetical protein